MTGMAPERDETFRATLPARTPGGELHTLIVTRQGLGPAGRTWLTLDGAIRTTAVLADELVEQLVAMLTASIPGSRRQ